MSTQELIGRMKFEFYNKYPIPDLKYPILELELIFNSQAYFWQH